MAQTKDDVRERISAVREFNRFYTQKIGVLDERFLRSPFTITEVRVLRALAQRDELAVSDLRDELGINAAFIGRIVDRFEERKFIETPAAHEKGKRMLRLTRQGHRTFRPLDERADEAIRAMFGALDERERGTVVEAMETIHGLLGGGARKPEAYVLRSHQPGDMGWVIERHGALYSSEFGWNQEFEALVADICARFLRNFDPQRERCWIAVKGDRRVGSVFLVSQSKTIAKLRLLLVDPVARGLGIGERLVEECVEFARNARYRKVRLWTNSVLTAARRIYEAKGFRVIEARSHRSFGQDLVAETWELVI